MPKTEAKSVTRRIVDSLAGVLTSIGNGKAQDVRFTSGKRLTKQELAAMWDFSWLTRKIVAMPVDDAFRVPLEITSDDADVSAYIRARWYQLDMADTMKRALYWMRLYGGGAVILLVKERSATDPSKPLNLANVDGIVNTIVASCFELQPSTWYDDPLSPKFGMPETFTYTPSDETAKAGSVIHESRIIAFRGAPAASKSSVVSNSWWGSSFVQNIYDEIRAAAIFEDCTVELAQDFVSRIFKMDGLADLIANDKEDQVRTRVALVNKLTPHRTAVIDGDEELTKQQAPIGGYGELITYFADLIAGASGIPRAKLFSQQLGTLAGAEETTGDYDRLVLDIQESCSAQIDAIFRVIAAEKNAPKIITENDYEWKFAALHPRDEKAAADARSVQASIDKLYIDAGVLSPDEVRASRFGSGDYSFSTTIEIGEEESEEPVTIEDAVREAQTYIVPKSIAKTQAEAIKIAKKYGATVSTIRETEESWRFRQRPPEDFVSGSFRTFKIPDSGGVVIVFGTLKEK